MSSISLSFSKGIEIISNGELPTPLVYALSVVLVAIAIKIVLWRPRAPKE